MSVSFGDLQNRLFTDNLVFEMARPVRLGTEDTDALAFYAAEFSDQNIKFGPDPSSILRALFVRMIGLGMRESSGQYCAGHDNNVTSDTAEAGLFQSSFDLTFDSDGLYTPIFERYAESTLLQNIFARNVECGSEDSKNVGTSLDGITFQKLSKECPSFAIEIAALGLRHKRQHWGPVNRRDVEILPACDTLLRTVQFIIN